MKTSSGPIGAGLLVAAFSAIAVLPAIAADVSVTFVHPENYSDASYSRPSANGPDRASVLRDFEQHLEKLAERGLSPRESLSIEVLDIDLAGQFEPLRFGNGTEIRVVRDVTAPRIELRYTLSRDGMIVANARESVSGTDFLMSANRYSSSDRLRYEKAVLDDWFEARFGRR